MRRCISAGSLAVVAVLLAACSEKPLPTAPGANGSPADLTTINANGCVDGTPLLALDVEVRSLIGNLFTGQNLQSALSMWENIKKDQLEGRPVQNHIDNLAGWTIGQLTTGGIQDPDGTGLLNATTGSVRMLHLVFRCSGVVPTQLPPSPPGFDAAFVMVDPSEDTDQQFNTSFGDGAAFIPRGSLKSRSMLALVRQPDDVQVNTPFPKLSRTADVAIAGGGLKADRKISVLFCPLRHDLPSEVMARAVMAHQVAAVPPGAPIGQGVEYLDPPQGGHLPCPHDISANWREEKGFWRQRMAQVASLASKAWSYIGPRPLYAGHAAIGGSLGGFSPIVIVDPYVQTEVVLTPVSQPLTFGDATPVTARLRIRDVPANPAVYRGQWVNPDAVTTAVNNLAIGAHIDAGAASATTIDAASIANWSFPCVDAGAHVATVDFAQTIIPANAPMYGASTASANFVVNQRDLTVTAANKSRLYGDANPPLTGALVGVQTQCDAAAKFAPMYATAATPASDVGTYPISADVAFDESGGDVRAANYNLIKVSGTLTIDAAPLDISANNKTREYGLDNPTFDGSVLGIKNSDAISLTFSTTANIMSEVGTYPIVPAAVGARLFNYYIRSTTNGALSITPAPLTLNIGNATRVYGDANPPFTHELLGVRNSDALIVSLSTTAGTLSPVGPYVIDGAVGGPRAGNYNLTKHTGTLTVTLRSLSVAGNNATRAYGDANPGFTGVVTNAVAGDGLLVTYTSPAVPTRNVGTYPIEPHVGGAAASNYAPITLTNGTLAVTQRTLTGSIDNKEKFQGDPNPTLTGTVNGVVAGDGFVVTLATTATTASPVGTYPITLDLSVAGGANYTWGGTNGTLTVNTRDNVFISVIGAGTGGGLSATDIPGLSCSPSVTGCTRSALVAPGTYQFGKIVSSGQTSYFAGWGGDAASCGTNSFCDVVVGTTPVNITARYEPGVPLTITTTGNLAGGSVGTNPSTGFGCIQPSCTYYFAPNTAVTVSTSVFNNQQRAPAFESWNIASCGTANTCVVNVGTTGGSITAQFSTNIPVSGSVRSLDTGSGRVTTSPAGIDCTTQTACGPLSLPAGDAIVFTATPNLGSMVDHWETVTANAADNAIVVACGSASSCAITPTGQLHVRAVFTLDPAVAATVTISVIGAGTGGGLSATDIPGLSCSPSVTGCTRSALVAPGTYQFGKIVSSGQTSYFAGWGGDAASCGTNSFCDVVVGTTPVNITARYEPGVPLTITTTGNLAGGSVGTNPSTGFGCIQPSCTYYFAPNTAVTVSTSVFNNQQRAPAFESWNIASCGTANTCVVNVGTTGATITANFATGEDTQAASLFTAEKADGDRAVEPQRSPHDVYARPERSWTLIRGDSAWRSN